jgi:MFS family permease
MSSLIFGRYRSFANRHLFSGSSVDRNMNWMYIEILFGGLVSAAISFNTTFVIRLGATKETVALLTALPALITALSSIPLSRFMHNRRRYKSWLLSTLLTFRFGYLVVAFIPLLLPDDRLSAANFITGWIILLTLPLTMFDIEWRSLMGELIPENRRSFFFSRRAILFSLTMALATALVGWILDRTGGQFPANYQIMYIFTFAAGLVSHFLLTRLTLPERPPRPASLSRRSPAAWSGMTLTQPMKRLLFNNGIYTFGIQFYIGLSSIQLINNLHASDDWIGLNIALGSVGGIIGFLVWERLLRKHEYGWVLRRASLLTWIYPAALAYANSIPLIVAANFAVNLMHPGMDLSTTNLLLRLPRSEDRSAYIGVHTMIMGLAAMTGPLLGVWASNTFAFGIPGAIFMSAILRVGGGLLFNFNRIDETPGDSYPPVVQPIS